MRYAERFVNRAASLLEMQPYLHSIRVEMVAAALQEEHADGHYRRDVYLDTKRLLEGSCRQKVLAAAKAEGRAGKRVGKERGNTRKRRRQSICRLPMAAQFMI
jgi:hypothetical protein